MYERDVFMMTVKIEDAMNRFDDLYSKAINGETIMISGSKSESVVMLSESKYNVMLKAKRNADYLAMIDKSMAEAGGFITKNIIELEHEK